MGATRNGSQTLPQGPPKLGEQGAASSRIGPYSYVEDVYEKLPTTLELEKMLSRDTQPRALENALVLPVRQAPFEIEEATGDAGEAEYVRDTLLKPSYQGGMTTPISAVIAQITGAFARRRTFFEKVWEIKDGKYTYHKLAFRRASTCSIIDDKNGSFNGFKQEGFLKDGTPFKKEFNPSKAFVFIHGFAPDDPLKGESAFDAAYQAHVNKMKIQFLQAMYLQKFGLPSTVGETDATSEEEQQKFLKKLEDLRGGGTAVLGPTERLPNQNLNSTSNAGDFKEALEYLDNQMARSVLAQFLLLGQGSNTGAWALSKDHSDFFVISEEARLRQIEWHFDNYVIAPLVYYNFGESASYPKLKFRALSESAVERSLEMFKDLVARGQMTPKPALVEAIEEKVAQVLDVDPEKLKEEEVEPVTSPTDNSPLNPAIQRAVDKLGVTSVNGNQEG